MSYREYQRPADIQAPIDAIRSHLQRGDLSDGLVFDAARGVRYLPGSGQVVVVPDGAADACTVPGWPGQIVNTAAC